jgi:co-chaperonin GroES (HSP10)
MTDKLAPTEQESADELNFLRRCIPLGENVLIEMDKPEEKSAGGIVLTEASKELQGKGVILAIGQGVTAFFDIADVGSRVRFPLFAFTEIKKGCPVVFINFRDIALLEPKE